MSSDSTKNDEESLFRSEMGGVTPLKSDNRIDNKVRLKKNTPLASPQSNQIPINSSLNSDFTDSGFTNKLSDMFADADMSSDAALDECPEILSFARSGLQHNILKKLRQGKNPVEHSLDLHGLTVQQARTELITFLNECESANIRHAIIVHGKGFGSNGKPVIKPMINRWLPQVESVLAFHSAQPKDGGSGAVYILLKKIKLK